MRNKIFLFLLPLLASAWLASLPACHKSEERITTIQGRITEYGTDAPIEGARIYLLCYDGSVFGGSSSTLGDSIVTDANGEFHREYPQDDVCGGSYMIVWKEGYFKRDGLGVTTGVNNVNIALDPEAWVKVVTIPDITGNSISFTGTFTGAAGWPTNGLEGTREFLFDTRGNRTKEISWAYYAPPVTYYKDTFYLPGHDTITYTIHY